MCLARIIVFVSGLPPSPAKPSIPPASTNWLQSCVGRIWHGLVHRRTTRSDCLVQLHKCFYDFPWKKIRGALQKGLSNGVLNPFGPYKCFSIGTILLEVERMKVRTIHIFYRVRFFLSFQFLQVSLLESFIANP